MSRYFYSGMNNAFYCDFFKEKYIKSGTWPGDLIEVTHEDYVKFIAPPVGKMLSSTKKGRPEFIDIPSVKRSAGSE